MLELCEDLWIPVQQTELLAYVVLLGLGPGEISNQELYPGFPLESSGSCIWAIIWDLPGCMLAGKWIVITDGNNLRHFCMRCKHLMWWFNLLITTPATCFLTFIIEFKVMYLLHVSDLVLMYVFSFNIVFHVSYTIVEDAYYIFISTWKKCFLGLTLWWVG